MTRTDRARPLAPEDRRNAILDAIVPLIVEHGTEVTSRQIAAAAGVAEGTVYRVFPDKETLILAAVKRQFDGSSTNDTLAAAPAGLGLRGTVEFLVEGMRNRSIRLFSLMAAVGPARMRELREVLHSDASESRLAGRHPMFEQAITTIADLLLPYREELRVPPRKAAQLIRLTVLAMSHPMMTGGENFSSDEIVDYIMHGIATSPTL